MTLLIVCDMALAQGVDLVWESVGGEMFETCVRALSNGGRLIVIGALWTVPVVCLAHSPVLCPTYMSVMAPMHHERKMRVLGMSLP